MRQIISVTGEDSLRTIEKDYLYWADIFEKVFINSNPKSFEDTLDVGWNLLGLFPEDELIRINGKTLEKKYSSTKWEDFGYSKSI